MTSFSAMLLNNFRRYRARRGQILLMVFFLAMSVLLAVFVSSKLEIRANVALVSDTDALMQNVSGYNVTLVESQPPRSDLMLGRYDAVVTDHGDGLFDITSIKSDDIAEALDRAIRHPGEAADGRENRSVGANILGYLILVIFLQGLMFVSPLADDRASGALRRIATTPAGAGKYLLAQGTAGFAVIFVPAFFVIALAGALGLEIGFSLPAYAGYLMLITVNSVAFALMMMTLAGKPDDANAMGSSVALLTTILAGSYYDFSGTRPVFNMILGALPQKSFLTLVERANLTQTLPQLGYLLLFPAVLIALSAVIANRKLRAGV